MTFFWYALIVSITSFLLYNYFMVLFVRVNINELVNIVSMCFVLKICCYEISKNEFNDFSLHVFLFDTIFCIFSLHLLFFVIFLMTASNVCHQSLVSQAA